VVNLLVRGRRVGCGLRAQRKLKEKQESEGRS
jgi:hypothetical protein